MKKKMISDVVQVPMDYRPVPFWSWNGNLEVAELRHQIQEMHKAGIGGFFMHARSGLQTEYFSKEWFAAIKACIDEARKLGMKAWLYDENGWPSGFGCGKVNGKGIAYQQKYLRMTRKAVPKGGHLIGKSGDCKFYFDVNPYYVNLMDPKVTDEFIKCVHEQYMSILPEDMWRDVQGFFTDEPQLGRFEVPWSETLPELYRKEYGVDILDDLQAIFEDCDNQRVKRVRFWSLVAREFCNNYQHRLHDWCKAHGVMLTGHNMLEESPFFQLCSSAEIMPNYEYYDIPGVDKLGRTEPAALAQLQLLSVAAQTGKKRMMTESFACCGWNVSFQDMKWLYQLQMVRGCNFLCQHLQSYSLEGVRKRDYPASLFQHQPWWNDYRHFNDYISRVGYMLGEGEIRCDVLLLHPQSSMWCDFTYRMEADETARWTESENYMYCKFIETMLNELEQRQINFHLGDEMMIAKHGKVSGDKFIIGKQQYSVVIMPQIKNISGKELDLLLKFIDNGGCVFGVRNSLDEELSVDGKFGGAKLKKFVKACLWFESEAKMAEALSPYAFCDIEGENTEQVLATTRYFADWQGQGPAEFVYVINRSREDNVYGCLQFDNEILSAFDATTGQFQPYPAGVFSRDICLEPGNDLMLMVKAPRPVEPKALNNKYSLEMKGLNTLTLDFCRCYVNGKLKFEHLPTISLMPELLDYEKAVDVKLEFDFEVDPAYDCSRQMYLLVEKPSQFKFKLNGKSFKAKEDGYMYDKAFHRVLLPAVRAGKNVLTLETRFAQSENVYDMLRKGRICESEGNKITFDMELESVYLAGEFGVRGDMPGTKLPRKAERVRESFVITEPPVKADCRNIQDCGLPFFAGTVVLKQKFNLPEGAGYSALRFENMMANVAKVRINGAEIGSLVWSPYSLNIPAGILKEKGNEIEIELTGSLRNLLGPHHLEEGESYGISPVSFFCRRHYLNFTPPAWNDDYCFVRFGFDKVYLCN